MSPAIEAATPLQTFEHALASLPPADCRPVHSFTPGLYMRQVTIPAGTVQTSMVTRVDFPLVVLRGELEIITPEFRERIVAPCVRIMKAGTKRVVNVLVDVEMIGFFANPDDETDPDEIGRRVLHPLDNPLIHDDDPHANIWRSDRKKALTNS